jgi:hypothetical protein
VVATRQPVTVRLTPAQSLRMEQMGETLWPTEKLSAGEVTRRLALTQLKGQRGAQAGEIRNRPPRGGQLRGSGRLQYS